MEVHSETQNLRDFREVIWHKDCMVSGSPGGSGEAPRNRAQKIEEHSPFKVWFTEPFGFMITKKGSSKCASYNNS